MNNQATEQEQVSLEQLIALVEQALSLCDELGYTFAAIDICAAAEKLRALQHKHAACRPSISGG
ncbi:hypothetical protein [Erythrobacter sp.]|uniref:hypothetical protein n=1 Tax=Erythrobacter sp. TaxID=1042 RepID=UPI0025D4BD38|nr:hypothetical protein [Erythrobacter sp.]